MSPPERFGPGCTAPGGTAAHAVHREVDPLASPSGVQALIATEEHNASLLARTRLGCHTHPHH